MQNKKKKRNLFYILYCTEQNYDLMKNFANKYPLGVISCSLILTDLQMTQNFLEQCYTKKEGVRTITYVALYSITRWDDGFGGNIWQRNTLSTQLFTLIIRSFSVGKKDRKIYV